jgi:hypothetical protein
MAAALLNQVFPAVLLLGDKVVEDECLLGIHAPL